MIEEKIKELKSEFALDLRAIGKELAIDIVALNKKIDSKHQSTNENLQRITDQIKSLE